MKVLNPKTNLCKHIDTHKYTAEEVDKIIVFYLNIGYYVTAE